MSSPNDSTRKTRQRGELSPRILPGRFSLYRLFFRPLLFFLDAERAHHWTIKLARAVFRIPLGKPIVRIIYVRRAKKMPVELAGLKLSNPLGLAAGFDKNALLVPGIESLGFGFVEIGTVTPRPQEGNAKPRLHRIPEKRAIVNRMGFNNDGADVIAARLKEVRSKIKVPLGVNLGKNRDTPNADAAIDYETLFKVFRPLADYFVINISSPNTPGLRDLQSTEFATALGEKIQRERIAQPVFVKLGPDLPAENLKALCALCGEPGKGLPYAGLILTNTIPTDLGGLSGYPLKGPSVHMLKLARSLLPLNVPIISVGGIENADDVRERLASGANAVQLYSALIYSGPGLPGRILRNLNKSLKRN
jgi:dihydroorotate dehydrogenase